MLLDGALATSLQPLGLPRFTPVNSWLESRPEAVAGVHQDFAAAGAELVLSGTFRLLPHLETRWAELGQRAVELATSAGVPVWLSVGPGGTAQAAWDGDATGFARLVERLGPACSGVVLETFVDPEELRAAVAAVRGVWRSGRGPLVACLSPSPSGQTWGGEEVAAVLPTLRSAGADLVGFNCGPGCVAATRRCLDAGQAVDWLKPNLDDEPLSDEILRAVPRVGGCCGWTPTLIAALGERRHQLGIATQG